MACRLFGAKLLPELMLSYCQLDPWEQTSVKFESKYKIFIHENSLENVVCQMAVILFEGNELSYHDSHLSSWDSKLWHIIIFLVNYFRQSHVLPNRALLTPGADPEHEKKYLRIFSMSIPRSPFGNVACPYRTDSWLAPSQWETSLQSSAVSHWLGANLESALPLQLLGPKRHSEYSSPQYMGVKRRHLTHGGLGEMVVILQMTFSNVYLSMKMFNFLSKISFRYVPMCSTDDKSA